MNREPTLHVVTYHYVRDLPRTKFPRLKGLMPEEFRAQIAHFASRYEMATLKDAHSYLLGGYKPARDLCLLTFDDGLKEHYAGVMPLLVKYGIQGIFGIITSCVEDHRVASVHMNHFLMASLGFEAYRNAFIKRLQIQTPVVDHVVAQKSYPLDECEVASFKYLFNFLLDPKLRDGVVGDLFVEHIGAEAEFSRELYMSWGEIRGLQRAGMVVAGHSHEHNALATLPAADLFRDLATCRDLLDRNVYPQTLWPFSYPYGKTNSYSADVISRLCQFGFNCAFDTERADNDPGCDLFRVHRIDCNGALETLRATRLRNTNVSAATPGG
jgi:peptidoglycan/xylan/chitin deacetylase (PgdA/CDA1 family)